MDDWKVGDLALCIKQGPWRHPGAAPAPGSINTVRAVGRDGKGTVGLWLEGFPGTENCDGFAAFAFRKIAPHEPDSEDAETIYQLVYAPRPAFREPVSHD